MKVRRSIIFLVLAVAIHGCSIEINTTPVSTALATPEANAGAATSAPNSGAATTSIPAQAKLPVTWGHLNLTGRLVYNAVDSTLGNYAIQELDLVTGELRTLIQFPQPGWSDAVAVSLDYKTMLVAYTPPAQIPHGGQQSLYLAAPGASEPSKLLVIPPTTADSYFQPEWSPDGKTIYMAHNNYQTMLRYEIMQISYPEGKLQPWIANAFWPRPSLDGSYLVYVALDEQTGKNQLSLANADGSDAHPVPLSGLPVPDIIDAPMITPDNQSILFSSPDQAEVYKPNWVDRLLDVQVASANGSLPSDWWSVPISGGTATRLTNLHAMSLYGVYSPDREYIACYSLDGIFVMKPDGTAVTSVVKDVGKIVGRVAWTP